MRQIHGKVVPCPGDSTVILPTVVGNNAVRDSEAHAGAFSHLFGGEEGFKNAFLYFRRDPMTTIMHDNAYIATGMQTRMQGGGVWPQVTASRHTSRRPPVSRMAYSAFVHRFIKT